MKTKYTQNKKSSQQKGFSLIELMIVIVIIGILGSIAMPAYKDYVIRAKVTEFFTFAQPTKLAITEALMSGKAPAKIDNTTLGLDKIDYPKNISNISVKDAIITITGNTEALDLPTKQTLTIALTPIQSADGMISWNCTTASETKKYVPTHCRD